MLTITKETLKAVENFRRDVRSVNNIIEELHKAGYKIDVVVTETLTVGQKYACPRIDICAFEEITCLPAENRIDDRPAPVERFGIADVGA